MNLQKKISSLMEGFRHFVLNNFDFKTEKFQLMEKELSEKDKKTFFCNMNEVNYKIIRGFVITIIDLLAGSSVALYRAIHVGDPRICDER